MLEFVKLEGLGNDFILVDALKQDLTKYDFRKLAPKLCDRHFGIGADGILIVQSSTIADFRMQIINADGSEPQMCGNGIRCFSRYIYESYEQKATISVETLAGLIFPVLDPKHNSISVDMGEPILNASKIPVVLDGQKLIDQTITVADKTFKFTPVSMGNPHAVIFVDDVRAMELSKYGPLLEHSPMFPERANIEFIQVVDAKNILMRVWERGADETLACGTGACAAVVAGVLTGKTGREVTVQLAGGKLEIEWDETDNHVFMSGPAYEVFRGTVKI
jgi:diaminopimelate epimerase